MNARRFGWLWICCVCALAQADVTTNYWTNADGGSVCATNEFGERVNIDVPALEGTNVMVFALHDGAVITNDTPNNGAVGLAGYIFRPAEDEENPWPTWQLINGKSGGKDAGGFRFTNNNELDYNPLFVSGGTLILGESMGSLWPVDGNIYKPVRKEGDGTVRVSKFYPAEYAGRTLEITDGQIIPMKDEVLRYARVVETSDSGHLVLSNYTKKVALGGIEPYPGHVVDAQRNHLVLGADGTTLLPGTVTNYSQLSAVARSVAVTNLEPGAVYMAQSARLRLDSQTGAAIPFAKYDFEESLTKDSSGHGRDLTAAGTVELVDDPERGGKVAHFTATANAGGKLSVTVSGQTELTGDTDYTVSLWAKTAAPPTANGYPTMFSLGSSASDHQLVQFRFMNANCNKLLLGHWGSPGDYLDIPATSTPSAWHHYIVMRQGGEVGVWIDGIRVLRNRRQAFVQAMPKTVTITLGKLAPMDRFFAGDLDDVRIYSRAVGEEGVDALFRGEEPAEGGALAVAGAPLEIPSETRLETGLNGEIYLAGTQTLAKVYGDAARGGVVMPAGGELRMTGPGRYNAGVSGTADFVKTGDGKLTLGGALTHTGVTHVEAGTLALAPLATMPRPAVAWDFEDPANFGDDATGGRYPIYAPASGVTRVWDESRQSHVARFAGTVNQVFGAEYTTSQLTGDSDYTISVWAKPASDCPAAGTFVSLGQEQSYQEIVFRYQTIGAGTIVLSHWGTTYDFTGVTSPANPQGVWHHYAATRRGDVFTVYCDGVQTWTTTKANTHLAFPPKKKFVLGSQLNKGGTADRIFKGDLDDVRIYGAALGAADIARLAAGREPTGTEPGVAPAIDLPTPVMHYAFEDATQPGKDSASGANNLTKKGSGTFKFVDSPLGGKALQFDLASQVYLASADFPTALPANGKPFTVSLWVQTTGADNRKWIESLNASHSPTFICWGRPRGKETAGTIGYMLSYWHNGGDDHGWVVPRAYLKGGADINFGAEVLGAQLNEGDLRWHHYASVYQPAVGFLNYVDGRLVCGSVSLGDFKNDMCSDGGIFYLGAKTTALDVPFRGALDEVKIFDQAFDIHQVRALMRQDMGAPSVLPQGARVTVDAGATLDVGSADESFAALEGAGTLAVDGRVTLTGTNTFNGSVIGTGIVALPVDASFTLGTACAAYAGYWDVAPGAEVVPPVGVTTVGGTFRPTAIDAATQATYPGAVEIADGTAIAVTTSNHGPLVATATGVTIKGGGTVTLPTEKTVGTWILARGASVVDVGTGDLNTRWTVSNAGTNVKPRFSVVNGDFVCTVSGAGSMFFVR